MHEAFQRAALMGHRESSRRHEFVLYGGREEVWAYGVTLDDVPLGRWTGGWYFVQIALSTLCRRRANVKKGNETHAQHPLGEVEQKMSASARKQKRRKNARCRRRRRRGRHSARENQIDATQV